MKRRTLWLLRAFARGGLLAATAATVLVSSFLLVAIVGLCVQSLRPAVRDTIAAGPIRTVGVAAETTLAADSQNQDAAARRMITRTFSPADVRVYRTVSTASLPLTQAAGDGTGDSSVVFMLDEPELRSSIRLQSGSWSTRQTRGAYPVAIQANAARAMKLAVGDEFDVPSSNGSLRLRVGAVWQPKSAAAAIWFGDQRVASGSAGGAFGPLIVSEAALQRLDATQTVRWIVQPVAARVTPDDVPALVDGFAHLHEALSSNSTVSSTIVTLSGDGKRTARGMEQALASLGAVMALPIALLTVGTVLSLILLARLLAETRAGETALLRARGARGASLVRVAAVEAAVVGVIGAAVGGALATGLIAIVSGGLPSAAVLYGLPALAAACAIVVQAAVVTAWLRAVVGVDTGRVRTVASFGLTALVVIAAGFSLWRFLQFGAAGGAVGLAGIAAPALTLLAAVMVGLVVFAPLSGVFERTGSRSSKVPVVMAARHVGRGLQLVVAPAALIILAVGGTALGAGYIGTFSADSAAAAKIGNAADIQVSAGRASPLQTATDGVDAASFAMLADVESAIPAVRADATIGDKAVAVVASPIASLPGMLEPFDGLVGAESIRSDLLGHTRADRVDHNAVTLPRKTSSLSVTIDAASPDSVGTGRSVQTTLWIQNEHGQLVPLTFDSVQFGARPAAVRRTASVPVGGPWHVIAVDAHLLGGAPGDSYRFEITAAKTTAGGDSAAVALANASDWHVVAATGAPSAEHGVTPQARGVGFSTPLFDATSGAMVRLMQGEKTIPAVAITKSLADASSLASGDRVEFDGVWWTLEARVDDVVPVVPGAGDARGALIDLGSLNDAILRTGATPPAANETWIRSGQQSATAKRVAAVAPDGAIVTIASPAFANRFFGSAILGLRLGSIGCVCLAVIALAAAAAALSRRRRSEVAVLRALGFTARQQVRSRQGELWAVAGAAVVIGLAAGALVDALVAAPLARLSVVTAPAGLAVSFGPDPFTLVLALAGLGVAVCAVVFAYGASIGRQAADSEYREETR